MSAERDRLAALLHEVECDPRLTFDCEVDHQTYADRLIAAGVTLREASVGLPTFGQQISTRSAPPPKSRRADLDVERLARALLRVQRFAFAANEDAISDATRIVAAYREDAT